MHDGNFFEVALICILDAFSFFGGHDQFAPEQFNFFPEVSAICPVLHT